MQKSRINIKDMTYISMSVAALIGGGFAILQLSTIIPIPGIKYIFMAPFISIIIYILLEKIKSKFLILYFGLIFSGIMAIFSVFMFAAIFVTTLCTQMSFLLLYKLKSRKQLSAALFSTYMGIFALFVSKIFIGGVYESLTLPWIVGVSIVCTLFGLIGVRIAVRLLKHIKI